MTEKENKNSNGVSRREFLKDAGLLVGGTAIGSTVLLAACGDGDGTTVTKTVTEPGGTTTVTTTAGEVTKTETATITDSIAETKFVCPIDGQEFDSFDDLQAHFEAEHGEAPVAALNIISLTVNEEKYQVQIEPNWTIRDVLHDKLGITSTKEMCLGYGACGSCTIILNGRPVLSCLTLATDCDNSVIETAEGIAKAKHPLVDAYITNYCAQCGYCTPGYIATAKALLDHNPNPSEEDIRDMLAGNICRCGTYPQHILAIQEAAGTL